MIVDSGKLLVGTYEGDLIQIKFSSEGIAHKALIIHEFKDDLILTKLKEKL